MTKNQCPTRQSHSRPSGHFRLPLRHSERAWAGSRVFCFCMSIVARPARPVITTIHGRSTESMSKVFVNIGLSLDGYMAPPGMTLEHWSTPEYENWGARWGELMGWILKQQYFRERLHEGSGGETGAVNDMLRRTFERTGAHIMGKRMFEQGEVSWPAEAPFRTPVFVLTSERRASWVRPGGTSFHFINDGPESALEQTHNAA